MERLRHHNLAAWKYSDEFFFEVHRLVVERFPRSDRYELGSQLRRAALSVPANIVEGLARRTQAEQSQFLRTAWASLLEADYYLSVAQRLGYLDEGEHRAVGIRWRGVAGRRTCWPDDEGNPARLTR